MTDEQSIIIDILKIVPDNSICFINAPSIYKDSKILQLLIPSTDYDWSLALTPENKIILSDIIISESIQNEFHKLDIIINNFRLCESYDGMCTVILSNKLDIPEWFTNKYVQEGICWSMK